MKPAKGYYSVIQYCPDPSRAEGANVGVLLACPELHRVEVRMSGGNDRVRRFFRGKHAPLEEINAAKDAIAHRVQAEQERLCSSEALKSFIETRANEIVMTPPRPMKVLAFERDIDALFSELVGERKRASVPRGLPALNAAFNAPRFKGKIRRNYSVRLPVLHRQISVPYAYRNGAVQLIKVRHFSSREDTAIQAASELAVSQDLFKKYDPEHRLVVIAHFDDPEDKVAREVRDLFREFDVNSCLAQDIGSFVEEVAREARPFNE